MMKKHRNNIFIILFTVLLLITNLSANVIALPTEKLSIPNHVSVTVGDEIINEIAYENFILEAKRIETSVGPGYCLEVEKDYPSGQRFEFVGKPAR